MKKTKLFILLIASTWQLTAQELVKSYQYEDYTNLYADVTEGQSYTIDVDLGDCSNNNYPSGGKVYIDQILAGISNIKLRFKTDSQDIGLVDVNGNLYLNKCISPNSIS